MMIEKKIEKVQADGMAVFYNVEKKKQNKHGYLRENTKGSWFYAYYLQGNCHPFQPGQPGSQQGLPGADPA